jgi:hypothetical protein
MATPGDLGKEGLDSLKKVGDSIVKNIDLSLDSILDTMIKVDDAARDLSKQFGLGNESIQAMKVGLTNAVVEVTKLGGSFENIVTMQTEIAGTLGRNVILSSDLYGKLYAASEVTGKSGKEIVSNFRDVGASSFQAVEGMQKVVDVARSQGVNARQVSDQVLSNMGAMNKFTFQGGVEGLSKMASQAVGLRINMSSTLDIAERLFNPEDAIEMAAGLQRLGVAQSDLLDPLRLMDLAQNDPAELQNQIVKMSEQFVQLNEKGQFEIMPGARRQLMEVEKQLGLSRGELSKMALGAAELDMKMQKIDFGSRLNLSEDQKKMIANMAEMGTGKFDNEFVITTKEGEQKRITEIDEEDLKYFAEASKPKSLEDIQKEQLKFLETIAANTSAAGAGPKYGFASTGTVTKAIEGGKKIAQRTGDILTPKSLQPESMRKISDESLEKAGDAIKKLVSGESSLTGFFTAMGDVEKGLTNFGDKVGTEIFESIDKNITEAAKSSNPFEKGGAVFLESIKKMFEQEMKGGSSLPSQTTTQRNTKDAIVIHYSEEDTVKEVNGLAVGTNLGGGMTGEQKLTGSVDVNLNINLNSNNTNVSANDIINAMRSGEVQQQLISSITDAINNGMKGNINPQLNPYSANPLLSV